MIQRKRTQEPTCPCFRDTPSQERTNVVLLIKVFRKEQAEEHSENEVVSVVPLGCTVQANRRGNHKTQAPTRNEMASLTEMGFTAKSLGFISVLISSLQLAGCDNPNLPINGESKCNNKILSLTTYNLVLIFFAKNKNITLPGDVNALMFEKCIKHF